MNYFVIEMFSMFSFKSVLSQIAYNLFAVIISSISGGIVGSIAVA